MQSKDDLEEFYSKSDPWGYETTADDFIRKQKILDALSFHAPFKRALDIGCGEGFITQDLPAKEIHGIELSDKAAKRLPKTIKRVKEPQGEYDLILATGILYAQYDYAKFINWINDHAKGIVLTCNIESWEVGKVDRREVHTYEFPYRTYTQVLRVFK